MSIQSEIERISKGKEDIILSLNKKGAEIPNSAKISEIVSFIEKWQIIYSISFEVDEDGNFYLIYKDGSEYPKIEYDEASGNLYQIIE